MWEVSGLDKSRRINPGN